MKSTPRTLLIAAVALAACLLSACNRKSDAPSDTPAAPSASAPMGGASTP